MRRLVTCGVLLMTAGLLAPVACSTSCSSTDLAQEGDSVDSGDGKGGSDAATDREGVEAGRDVTDVCDSGLPSDQSWLVDPTIWHEVEGGEFLGPECVFLDADRSRLAIPKLVWNPCATSSPCEETDVVQGYGAFMGSPTMSTHAVEGSEDAIPYLSGNVGVVDGEYHYALRRTLRLDDGTTTDASLRRIPAQGDSVSCIFGSNEESALRKVLKGTGPGGVTKELNGFAGIPGRGATWNQPWLPKGGYLSAFDADHGGGIHVFLSPGAAVGMLTPGSSETTVLASGVGFIAGAGEGALVAWSKADAAAWSIEGWSPSAGSGTVTGPLPFRPCKFGMSSTRLVGVTGADATMACGEYAEPKLWSWPRVPSPDQGQLSISPSFSAKPVVVGKVSSWGEFAAAYVTEVGVPQPYLLLARVPDWTFRRIPAAGEFCVHDYAFTLTERYLYVAFTWLAANQSGRILSVKRFDLTKLSQIGEAL